MTNCIDQINKFRVPLYDCQEIWDLWPSREGGPTGNICDIIFGEKVIPLTEPDGEL